MPTYNPALLADEMFSINLSEKTPLFLTNEEVDNAAAAQSDDPDYNESVADAYREINRHIEDCDDAESIAIYARYDGYAVMRGEPGFVHDETLASGIATLDEARSVAEQALDND